jgi:hypothetical protein
VVLAEVGAQAALAVGNLLHDFSPIV